MSHLHVFDMDGTLIHGTSANLEIARIMGTEPEITDLERRFSQGEIDTRFFATTLRELWDDLTDDHVEQAFTTSPFLDGIREVANDIREHGERSVVITMAPDFYARRLLEFGFDEVLASRHPAIPFNEPVLPENILTPADKVRLVEEVRERESIPLARCVAYGDSKSDGPLFEHLENTIAVNGDDHLTGIARTRYDGSSLLDAYARARGLLGR